MSEDLRYPIGKFDADFEMTGELIGRYIEAIAGFPELLRETVEDLRNDRLDTPYRPGGWTVRQVVHHIADSHLNALCRFKLALTEDHPTIRPYMEDRWAELADSRMSVGVSLKIIEGVHARWAEILNSMTDEEFKRKLNHPESGEWTLDKMLAQYDWHGRHHLAHITTLLERENR